ncbi:hypothetical protein GH714_030722 [Hevea brasiliensis]|uniref:CSC1/OSCA1-like 7TM region domain-containing protein n=1 Tax=Hevea brasiliensis TaxID=3981 RepID=A0A6A6LGB3_HEVBR|nr:hypothetical protein GH714_030722 [Hevea brasiliensis]
MLVSALLTSLGINSGLCVLFFILYSILRNQPSNYEVYVPRLLVEGNSKRRSHFNLERLIPSTGWIKRAWKLSEEDILSSSGLDAVVFMRVITFSLRVFSFAGIIGVFVLLPVNCMGTQLHEIDFEDLSNNSLDVFTISNVNSGSKWLWIHSAVYILTIFVCYLLYHNEAKTLYKRLLHLRSEPSQHKYIRIGFFGQKVDLVDHYEKIVQGLTNLSQLEIWFPFLKSILTITFVSQVITGYLPSLILQLFLKIVPPIMEFLSSIQGYISHSDIEKSACNKVLWFTIWNIFFATVFSGSVLYRVNIFLEPKDIPAKLAVAVPAQASFFIAYVVTSGWTSTASELCRIIPLIYSLVTRFCKSTDELEVPSLPYHRDIPRILFFALLGITYFFLAPLILPFLLMYLCLAYIIFSNQFKNVYMPKYETAGKFWPIVHNSMIFSLVLMHAISIGIFTLKKLSIASTLVFPLPVLTLLFNEYCRKRFLPIFIAYPAEVSSLAMNSMGAVVLDKLIRCELHGGFGLARGL